MPGTGNTSDGGLVIGGNGNIVRYNSVYGGAKMGLYFKYVNRNSKSQGGYGGRDARAYNNTIWNNGYFYTGDADIVPYRVNAMVMQYCGNSVDHTGIVLKNNILYQAADGDWDWGLCAACDCTNVPYTGPCSKMSDCVAIEQNWCTRAAECCARNGDPKFNNPVKVGDAGWSSLYYFSTSLPDLSLQPSSGAIDGGAYLTQARGGGSTSTNLIVDDALYFQDGSWGSALARGVTLFPDWIAIGTVTNTVQIAQGGINYSTNTITLASPMTWTNGAPIWLFKKSDGTKVLYGSAPDYGAYEYLPSGDTIPPAAPTGLVAN